MESLQYFCFSCFSSCCPFTRRKHALPQLPPSNSHLFPGFDRVSTPSVSPLQQVAEANARARAAMEPDVPVMDILITTTIETTVEFTDGREQLNQPSDVEVGHIAAVDGQVAEARKAEVPKTEQDPPITTRLQEVADDDHDHIVPVGVLQVDALKAEYESTPSTARRRGMTEDDRDHIGIFNDQGIDVTRVPKLKYRTSPCQKEVENSGQDLISTEKGKAAIKMAKRVSFDPPESQRPEISDYNHTIRSSNFNRGPKAKLPSSSKRSEEQDNSERKGGDTSFKSQQKYFGGKSVTGDIHGPRERVEVLFNHSSGPHASDVPKPASVYTNIWINDDEGNKVVSAYVNDQDVTDYRTNGVNGLVSNHAQNPPAPPTKLKKVQNALWDVGAAVDRVINSAERGWKRVVKLNIISAKKQEVKETEFEVDIFYHHNLPFQVRQHDKTPPGLLSAISETVYRTLTGRSKNSGSEQSVAEPDHAGYLGEGKVREIGQWIKSHAVIDWEEAEFFIACTTAQLKELNGEALDRVQVIKAYIGPPTSPAPEREDINGKAGEEGVELKELWEIHPSLLPPVIPFKEFNLQTVHKDLSRFLGIHKTGLHVLGSRIPENFGSPENLSDYYGMPILESPEQFRSNYIVSEDEPEAEDNDDDNASVASSNYDQTRNVFYAIHTQPPAHSLILYLNGKGLFRDEIAAILGSLDEKWVYKWDSRWWNGFRIPDHWQFSTEMVEQIKVKCKAEPQWWEKELDKQGKEIPPNFRILKNRVRIRNASHFAKKVLENYFWYRCRMGERYHKDI